MAGESAESNEISRLEPLSAVNWSRFYLHQSHLTYYKHHSELLGLIGKKLTVSCCGEGIATQALWDTGSKICLLHDGWRAEHIPH